MKITYIISLLISINCLLAVEHSFLIGVSRNYAFHNSQFDQYEQNFSCCGNFSNSSSDGTSANLFYGISIFDRLDIGLNGSYYQFAGNFKNSYSEPMIFNGEIYDGVIDNILEYKADGFAVAASIQYEPTRNLYLTLNLGINSITSLNFNGYRQLSQPDDIGFFVDSNPGDTTRVNQRFSDEISTGINPYFGLNVSYALPLNKENNLELRPNIGFSYNLNGFSGNENWSFRDVNFGLGLAYYINRKNPKEYFPNKEIIDSLLFVTSVPLTDQNLNFKDYIVTKSVVTNNLYAYPGIEISPNQSVVEEYLASHQGLSFIYDYSHLNYKGKAFVDIQLGFIDVSIPALGKTKNRLNFKIENNNLPLLADTVKYRLRVIGEDETRVGPWIKKVVNKKEKYETELTYFIGDTEVSPIQLEGIDVIQDGKVKIFSDDEKLLENVRSYFETLGIEVESEKIQELLPGVKGLIIRQNTTP